MSYNDLETETKLEENIISPVHARSKEFDDNEKEIQKSIEVEKDSTHRFSNDFNLEKRYSELLSPKGISFASTCFISVAWSPMVYATGRGAENAHIYFWIAKDLCWSQDLYYPSMIFGSIAIAWCGILLYHAIHRQCPEEVYMLIPQTMWLIGNFVWMAGEVFNDDDSIVIPQAAGIFEGAIAMILFYHVVLKPFKILPPDEYMTERYRLAGLVPRFSYFANWRQYEHAHTLCWLGKDLSWNQLNPYFWIICLIPTVLIAIDFIWVTFWTKRMMVDCVHYIAQLMWVLGNFTWALGQIFTDTDDSPEHIFNLASGTNARWYSSWVLFAAYFPIFLLYFVWLPLTAMGKFKDYPAID